MIKAPKDFLSGALFLLAGVGIHLVALDYPTGTASRMAPGFFPHLLAGALCLVGLLTAARALATPGEPLPRMALRPLLPLLAVVVFGFLLKPAGLMVAIPASIAVAVLGSPGFRWTDILILSALLIPFGWLVFVEALGLPLPLMPGG